MTADDVTGLKIAGGHSLRLRAIALALRGPPLQQSGNLGAKTRSRKPALQLVPYFSASSRSRIWFIYGASELPYCRIYPSSASLAAAISPFI